ncbi:hypothetical protein WOLCODRAFT_166355 [Wolfiporia cocos MD-104 SS10]|uniref:Uncharacterized protein n=1 Tax=Wolfiporia cocos (strain MD-104) TaxID=742152 RepID=A0A2H3J094_WOLCO|nr:hypothetical protein WOLCODRAFT_166355 [Wolfiporia cocos MD-104 SS10]
MPRGQLQALAKREKIRAISSSYEIIKELLDAYPGGVPSLQLDNGRTATKRGRPKKLTSAIVKQEVVSPIGGISAMIARTDRRNATVQASDTDLPRRARTRRQAAADELSVRTPRRTRARVRMLEPASTIIVQDAQYSSASMAEPRRGVRIGPGAPFRPPVVDPELVRPWTPRPPSTDSAASAAGSSRFKLVNNSPLSSSFHATPPGLSRTAKGKGKARADDSLPKPPPREPIWGATVKGVRVILRELRDMVDDTSWDTVDGFEKLIKTGERDIDGLREELARQQRKRMVIEREVLSQFKTNPALFAQDPPSLPVDKSEEPSVQAGLSAQGGSDTAAPAQASSNAQAGPSVLAGPSTPPRKRKAPDSNVKLESRPPKVQRTKSSTPQQPSA